jgi:hypothetical protein
VVGINKMPETEGQHIIEVSVRNFMGLIGLNIKPDGNDIVVVGKNAQGKTSFLEALRWALAGKDATKNKQPIRMGEEFAEVILKLDDMTISKYLSIDGKPQLKIKSNEEAYFPSPAAMLKKLVGELAYNPTDFMALHPKKQVEVLLSMIDTGEESIPNLDRQREEAYGLRTIINKDAKKYESLRNNCGYIPKDTPKEENSIAELSHELTTALAIEERDRVDKQAKVNNTHAIESKKRMIQQINEEIEIINKQNDDLLISINNYEDPNTSKIQDSINNAESINKQVRLAKDRDRYAEQMHEAQDRSTELTHEIEEIDETKAYILEQANMPVDGLGFDENGITLNGVELARCSSTEQIKVAMGVYFGTAPQGPNAIKIVIIQDGSLLDEDSLEYVKKICAEKGYQPIIEKVSKEAGANEILIESGEVKE